MSAAPAEGGGGKQVAFVLVKPDGVKRNLVDILLGEYETHGFECLARVKFGGRERLAERFRQHYAEHAGQPFFADLVREMSTNGSIVAAIFRAKTPSISGAADVTDAARTICKYIRLSRAESVRHNTIHVSDSPEAAAREIGIWFPPALIADLDL